MPITTGEQLKLDLVVTDKGTIKIQNFSKEARKALHESKLGTDKFVQGIRNIGAETKKTGAGFAHLTGNILKSAPAFAAATAAIGSVYGALRLLRQEFVLGFKAVEEYNTSIASMAGFVTSFSDIAAGGGLAATFENALGYSEDLVKSLEKLDEKTIASGQELTAMAEVMIQNGVFINTQNEEQVQGLINIATALKLVTKGMNQQVQIRQEVRALMKGEVKASDALARVLNSILDGNLKEQLKIWKETDTVLQNVGKLLVGFKGAAELLEKEWATIGSSLETIHKRVLRGMWVPVYEDLIDLAIKLKNVFVDSESNLTPFAKELQADFKAAYNWSKDLLGVWQKLYKIQNSLTFGVGKFIKRVVGGNLRQLYGEDDTQPTALSFGLGPHNPRQPIPKKGGVEEDSKAIKKRQTEIERLGKIALDTANHMEMVFRDIQIAAVDNDLANYFYDADKAAKEFAATVKNNPQLALDTDRHMEQVFDEMRDLETFNKVTFALDNFFNELDMAEFKIKDFAEEARWSIEDGITASLMDAQNGFRNLGNIASAVLRDIASYILRIGVAEPIGQALMGGLMGIGGSLFGRATGGPVSGRTPYMVGERGPELFVPSSSGNIVPNNQLAGGGGMTLNYAPVIQAVDTQSGLQFLAKHSRTIEQLVEGSYNKRAKRGPMA